MSYHTEEVLTVILNSILPAVEPKISQQFLDALENGEEMSTETSVGTFRCHLLNGRLQKHLFQFTS